MSIYWNDQELTIEPYHSKTKQYYCGRQLLRFDAIVTSVYTILVMDLRECCCADVYSDGEIKVLFKEHSEVPHKHRKGGQSAARFSRIRDNEITLWFKRINEYLKGVRGEFYLGMHKIYLNRFKKTLSTENLEKIKEVTTAEYADISGIYQYINKLEKKH